jgi:hypothetical protein
LVNPELRSGAQATVPAKSSGCQELAATALHFGLPWAFGAQGCCAARDKGNRMKAILTALVVAASLLAFGTNEASAYVCRAVGVGGSTIGRHWNLIDAKLIALRKCERRSPVPVCTLMWCR